MWNFSEKIQSDIKNIEADVINYFKQNIDAKSLKFTSAEGIQIPKTNFVLRGDTFRAEIFITAKNENQNPEIYVGEYDSLGGGKYEMLGDYEVVKVINGKGMFATRTTSEGNKKWGGLIAMKTETGTKMYPFNGEYLVAAKTAVVSPTNMNILYLEVDNPLKISVPGYTAGEITPSINNGNIIIDDTTKTLTEKNGNSKILIECETIPQNLSISGFEYIINNNQIERIQNVISLKIRFIWW